MVAKPAILTVEEFDRFALLPENLPRLLEYIGGELVEVSTTHKLSAVAAHFMALVGNYVLARKLGWVTSANHGYKIMNERYIPKTAFTSRQRKPKLTDEYYSSLPPDLVIELVTPSNTFARLAIKTANYLQAGTIVWLLDYEQRELTIHAPNRRVNVLHGNDILDGGNVLSGFSLKVNDLFAGVE